MARCTAGRNSTGTTGSGTQRKQWGRTGTDAAVADSRCRLWAPTQDCNTTSTARQLGYLTVDGGAMVPRDVAMAMIDEAVAVNHTPGLDDRSDSG